MDATVRVRADRNGPKNADFNWPVDEPQVVDNPSCEYLLTAGG
jgi:hypothetical protein